jgi:potassium/hydrogen antiporter
MGEISTFGLLVLTVATGAALLLAWSQITVRLPLPGAAFFLAAAAIVSNYVPDLEAELSIRSVERITVVALIVILFDGGMNVGWHRFRTALPAIGLLGIVGTAATAALMASFAHYLFGFRWILAGIIGAALAPTDPAVMFSVLRERQIGGRASIALEGEAGINDAVSIALVVGLVDYAHASHGSLLVVLREFLVEIGVGFAIGAAAGSIVPFLLRHARFPAEGLYAIASLVAAAVAYGAASYAHGSGFLAVLIVGVLLGAERTPHKGEIERFSRALASFAEMTAFAALGLTIDLGILGDRGVWHDGLLLALLLVLVARPVVVLPLLAPLRMRWGERLLVAWGGMKGAAPILLAALAVLGGFESERMYGTVFLVVFFSVVVQGGTVRRVADRLAIPTRRPEQGPGAAPEARRYRVSEASRADGSAVRNLPLGNRGWVDLIVRDGQQIKPRGRDVIRAGDDLVVASEDEARARRIRRLLEEPRRGGRAMRGRSRNGLERPQAPPIGEIERSGSPAKKEKHSHARR